jgi:hypothetical protein
MRFPYVCVCLATVLLSTAASGSPTLVLEDATYDAQAEDFIVLPVSLQGGLGLGISALDFWLLYDPGVLEVLEVNAGPAMQETNKLVQSNLIQPGELAVICMGLNQNHIPDGVIVEVVARLVETPPDGHTEVAIENTTLASSQGQWIPSDGSSAVIEFEDGPPSLLALLRAFVRRMLEKLSVLLDFLLR